jgi:predicted transcriptional regulator
VARDMLWLGSSLARGWFPYVSVLLQACCITIMTTMYGVLAASDTFTADQRVSSRVCWFTRMDTAAFTGRQCQNMVKCNRKLSVSLNKHAVAHS